MATADSEKLCFELAAESLGSNTPPLWGARLAGMPRCSAAGYLTVKEETGYHLRWFTPGGEIELCGHATPASAYVILNHFEAGCETVQFSTRSGILKVEREGSLYKMDFPTSELHEIPVTDDMERAFGTRPSKAILGMDLICVFNDEETVRKMVPDQSIVSTLPGRIQNVTARGKEADCISRSFAPAFSVPEDPVCGSAHCQIADYWSEVLGKRNIKAYQASKRGGYLYCERKGNGRIAISGEAVLVAVSEIVAEGTIRGGALLVMKRRRAEVNQRTVP